MIVACTGLKIPAIPLKAINSVAATATPIALIVVGAGFEGKKAIAKNRTDACGCFYQAYSSSSDIFTGCG